MSLQNTFKTWYVSGTIWVRLNGDLLSEYIFLYLSFWLSMLIFEGKDYCLTNTPQSLSVQMNIYIFLIFPLVHSRFSYSPPQSKQSPSSAWIFQWLKIVLMFSVHNLFSQIVNLGPSMIYKLIQPYTSLSSQVHTLMSLQVGKAQNESPELSLLPTNGIQLFLICWSSGMNCSCHIDPVYPG